MIITASWFTKLPDGYVKIGISRGVPRGLAAGYRLFKKLAPGPWFQTTDAIEYNRLFHAEILAPLDPIKTAAEIRALAPGKIPALCCYEPANSSSWCHRAIVAEWLVAALGEPIPEFGHEDLPQHLHPLMPEALRRG